MIQKEFSEQALKHLEQNLPVFLATLQFHEDDSFDCRIQSSNGTLFLWLATYHKENTLGFEYKSGVCPWHMHMSQLDANTPEDELLAVTSTINRILDGRTPIYYSTDLGHYLDDDNPNAQRKLWAEL
jgi:hypothetical protein